VARQFGVVYVLEPHNVRGPIGSVFVDSVGDEELYRIPGAASATILSAPAGEPLPSDNAMGRPVVVHHLNPATWRIVIRAATPQVLRLRITDVPGWHATIDGRPLALERFSGVILQARIPSGHHTITIHYWPRAFSIGLLFACCSAVVLCVATVEWKRLRKIRPTSTPLH
jgi:Bacterial membrane protein YfhO